jgi:hypothetical protein
MYYDVQHVLKYIVAHACCEQAGNAKCIIIMKGSQNSSVAIAGERLKECIKIPTVFSNVLRCTASIIDIVYCSACYEQAGYM